LARTGRFSRRLLDYLATFCFSGDVHAMPEGTVFFANEPILRVTAPLPEAQLVETRLINILHFQSLIAAKAARMVLLAPDKLLVDFGLRRAHGADAGLMAARSSYIAGFAGTSTVLAEKAFGIPIYGTMAHSFVQAFGDETAAFESFAHARPDNLVLLIDTYDTEAAARKVVALAPRLKAAGIMVRGVRIDSGDHIALSLTMVGSLMSSFSPAAVSRRIHLPPSRGTTHRLTALASVPALRPPRTRRHSIVPTSCRNIPGCRAANIQRARRLGRDASRYGGAMIRVGGWLATSSPLRMTFNPASP